MMTTKKNALYHEIDIPKELDEMINKTIEQINEERIQEKGNKTRHSTMNKGLAIALGIALIVVPLNVSKSVASFAGEIPVVGAIARLLTFRSYDFEEAIVKGEVNIPAVDGLTDAAYETQINELIEERVTTALAESKERAAEYKEAYIATGGTEEEYAGRKIEVKVDYKIFSSTTESLSFLVYSHESLAAVYATYEYYNIDLENNKELTLEEIVGTQYESIITDQVNAFIQETKNDIGYFDEALTGKWTFRQDMDFYLNTSGNVVVVFDKYELASGASGRLEVEISGY